MSYTVFFKRGDHTNEGSALYRQFKRDFGRQPDPRDAPNFEGILDRRFTIAVAEQTGWWANQLRELNWTGLDEDLWLDVFEAAQDPKNRERFEKLINRAPREGNGESRDPA